MLTVYSKAQCSFCEVAKKYLKEKDIAFEEKRIDYEKKVENYNVSRQEKLLSIDRLVAESRNGVLNALKPILEEILDAASKVNALSVLIVGGPPKGHSGYTDMISELEQLALEKGANA